MAPKKPSASVPRSNKIRFVLVEADLSDGNLSELTQAITTALKPTIAPIQRQLPARQPAPQPESQGNLDGQKVGCKNRKIWRGRSAPRTLTRVKVKSPSRIDRFRIAFRSPRPMQQTGPPIRRLEKIKDMRAGNCRLPFSAVQFEMRKSRIGGLFGQFSEKARQIPLQDRLCGGAGSLALTLLRPNSLVTGKNNREF